MDAEESLGRLRPRRSAGISKISLKSQRTASRKRLLEIVRKDADVLTVEDELLLKENANLVKVLLRNRERRALREQRSEEIEENDLDVIQKCQILARALKESKHAVVYSGAGISTSANIPDYRGPDGVWTLMKGGKEMPTVESLTSSKPTRAHMCLQKLISQGLVKHIVSQNCDGLHLRSGVPFSALSEIHGNMYEEVCQNCGCQVYHRIFDVTQRTSLHRHKTGRFCDFCSIELRDTIVHFGERSNLRWPHNWDGAVVNAQKCDLILCLGTSLKILRSYKRLWMMNRPRHRRPDLYIVNLQWTPKDSQAKMKLHAKVDFVLTTVLKSLNLDIPEYNWEEDPLLSLATSCVHEGPTISVPTQLQEKFCHLSKLNDNVSSDLSIKPYPDSNAIKMEVTSQDDDVKSSEPAVSPNNRGDDPIAKPAPPSWFGKGLRSKRPALKGRKRKRIGKN